MPYHNVSLTDTDKDALMAIGNRVLAPYGVTVTLPAVVRYLITQEQATQRKNDKTRKRAMRSLKENDLDD